MIDYKGGEQFEIDLPTRDAMFKDFCECYIQDEHHSDAEVREAFDVACANTEHFVQRVMGSLDIFHPKSQKLLLLLFSIKVAKLIIQDFDRDLIAFLARQAIGGVSDIQELMELVEQLKEKSNGAQ